MPEQVRAYIYRVSLAVMPLLLLWGFVKETEVPLYVGLIGAILNVGLASANTSTKPDA